MTNERTDYSDSERARWITARNFEFETGEDAMLKMIPEWVWASAVALLIVIASVTGLLYERSRAELATFRADVAIATQRAEEEARAKEQTMNQQLTRITKNAYTQNQAFELHRSSIDVAVGGLHDDIASLDASQTPSSTSTAAALSSARVARKLLGQCSDSYRDMALRADQLSDQVSGLQDFAINVCFAGQ